MARRRKLRLPRTQPRPAAPPRKAPPPLSLHILPPGWGWRVLLISLGLLVVALLVVVFASQALAALVRTFGAGPILAALLVLFGVLAAWRLYVDMRQAYHRLIPWLMTWNHPLGLGCLILAVLGAMAFFTPSGLKPGGVSLHEFSAGGRFGLAIIGSPNWVGGLRVVGLALAGLILVSPRRAWRLLLAMLRKGKQKRPTVRVPSPAPLLQRRRRVPPLPPTPKPPTPEAPAPPASALPSLSLLERTADPEPSLADNQKRARRIEEALASYAVEAKVTGINPGPTVTQFAVEPGWDRKYQKVPEKDPWGRVRLDRDGNPKMHQEEVSRTRVKVERITSLANNLALALAAQSIRVEAPIPGKPVVGLEVPNATLGTVCLRSVLENPTFVKAKAKAALPLALGKGMGGEALVADLTRMPHLLIAGQTGSGKTVCLHSFITCLLMHRTPKDLRLLMIDPKRVEMVVFNGVPHLLAPAIVEVPAAVDALRRVIRQMDARFKLFAEAGARNIEGYNKNPLNGGPLPYIVVIVDELADLMMASGNVVEGSLCRLAQLARATGIHLVVATQRPSVDVVTGLIKANFPSRVSFAVAAQVDSKIILDTVGAEKLLGRGDMLFLPPEADKPRRLQGCFVSDEEIARVVAFWQRQRRVVPDELALAFTDLGEEEGADPLLEKARALAAGGRRVSTSMLQRHLRIGYARAARLMDELEAEGTVEEGRQEEKDDKEGG